ncbi:MAG: hypothetical protein PHX60_13505 [Giesbergeria sp.]|nr:hypothetical protein [Giesbergeria sp.]MDD2610676.1 hypothetical protein [Giesbergeria sp.]
MKDIKEHRRQRLDELIAMTYHGDRGAKRKAAERIGCEASYLSRLSSGNRQMGEEFRAKVEEAFELPCGWLDLPIGTTLEMSQTANISSSYMLVVDGMSDSRPCVRGESPAYGAQSLSGGNAWPFVGISRLEWAKLTESQRTHAEACLRNLLDCVRESMGQKTEAAQ